MNYEKPREFNDIMLWHAQCREIEYFEPLTGRWMPLDPSVWVPLVLYERFLNGRIRARPLEGENGGDIPGVCRWDSEA